MSHLTCCAILNVKETYLYEVNFLLLATCNGLTKCPKVQGHQALYCFVQEKDVSGIISLLS
ncbi:hypothetical protein KFK09_014192 [Dendrobium nobile]|uniref:Uncharacterized protein n=1 Tax=Dendrobium nobile TaxID=94219 RepID=A0A8T3BB65_DENNO|nr:hypothetical protein KFK09_014192 [Dendrobium nobile]